MASATLSDGFQVYTCFLFFSPKALSLMTVTNILET